MERFVRPKAAVLPRSSLVPDRNLLKPPPDRFTHRLKSDQEYRFDNAAGNEPAGKLKRVTKVLLITRDRTRCRVADRRGLCVDVDCDELVELDPKGS